MSGWPVAVAGVLVGTGATWFLGELAFRFITGSMSRAGAPDDRD